MFKLLTLIVRTSAALFPFDKSSYVAVGNDLKLIDDAINEATLLMRENKEIEYNESES